MATDSHIQLIPKLRNHFSAIELLYLDSIDRFRELLRTCDGSEAQVHEIIRVGNALLAQRDHRRLPREDRSYPKLPPRL